MAIYIAQLDEVRTGMVKNILLTIAYDGTNYHGWQRQPEAITVQGQLEEVLSRILGTNITINGTSRTDAGVHAYGQRASFKADVRIPLDKLPTVINNSLASLEKGGYAISPIRILSAEEMPDDFHARFNSLGKEYLYRIVNSENVDVFKRNYVYYVKPKLDVEAMRRAAEYLLGTHDFKSFEAAGSTPRETTVRTIYGARIETEPEINTGGGKSTNLTFYIKGDGFLYNMVRIITGTLVDIGLGKIQAETLPEIIEAMDRSRAGHTAPPYGLYLSEVYYDASRLER